jgi:hypothetical protein
MSEDDDRPVDDGAEEDPAMELIDPRLGRTIRHRSAIDVLAEIA